MRYLWSRLILIFFLVEGLSFMIYYHFGPRGARVLHNLKITSNVARADIEKNQQENSNLKEEIEEWKQNLFFQEKFAREKLALKKENEIIFYR